MIDKNKYLSLNNDIKEKNKAKKNKIIYNSHKSLKSHKVKNYIRRSNINPLLKLIYLYNS